MIRDAEDAVHARDGYDYDGYRLRVEFPRGSQNGGGGRDRFVEQTARNSIFVVTYCSTLCVRAGIQEEEEDETAAVEVDVMAAAEAAEAEKTAGGEAAALQRVEPTTECSSPVSLQPALGKI